MVEYHAKNGIIMRFYGSRGEGTCNHDIIVPDMLEHTSKMGTIAAAKTVRHNTTLSLKEAYDGICDRVDYIVRDVQTTEVVDVLSG